jgi:RNA polymerase sigma-70 factor (ECF subfamily)
VVHAQHGDVIVVFAVDHGEAPLATRLRASASRETSIARRPRARRWKIAISCIGCARRDISGVSDLTDGRPRPFPFPRPRRMSSDSTTLGLDRLDWLCRLGQRLAADDHLGEDAAQEACLAALQHGRGGARAWLSTVLRNWIGQHRRSERARHARQVRAARDEAVPSTDELVQRAEVQRRVVASVLRLPPLYRDTVLLRFFDDLPPRAIAARLGEPVATVHSRLQRALQMLRRDLDRESDGRERWLAVLVALPAPPSLSLLEFLGLGLLGMKAKLVLAGAALIAAGVVPFLWLRGDARDAAVPAPDARLARGGSSGGSSSDGGAAVTAAASEPRRTAVPAPEASAAPARTWQVAGLVLDQGGAPLPGVEIGVRGADGTGGDGPRATSGADGRFRIELSGVSALAATQTDYVTVTEAIWTPEARYEPVIVVAPPQRLAGRVVDELGAGIAGAVLLVQAPEGFETRFSTHLDRTRQLRWNTRSDASGAFRLPRIPALAGATLLATADAFRPRLVPLPIGDDEGMEIVLAKFAYQEGQLTGVVVDPTGAPVPGALVTMGVTSVVTDRAGEFGLLLRRAGWPSALVAAKSGYLPARCELPANGGTQPADWPERVVLQLGQPPLSIRGRVVDQDGRPIPKAIVWATDPTLLGIAGLLPVQTEFLLAGGAVPAQAARMPVRFADRPEVEGHFTDHVSDPDEPSACWYFVTSDEQGAFEVPGLLPREYTLRALDVASGLCADAPLTMAGGTTEIRITRDHMWPVLRGKVVSRRGVPIPGAEVRHVLVAFHTNERVPGGRFDGTAVREGKHAATGADGTFTMRDVGAQHGFLAVQGDTILPATVQCSDIADPTAVVIEVEARCHVEVALANPDEADSVAARDAEGRGVDLAILRANSNSFETDLKLHAGKSGVFVLSERATELVLSREGKVVRTVALALVPGETLQVR